MNRIYHPVQDLRINSITRYFERQSNIVIAEINLDLLSWLECWKAYKADISLQGALRTGSRTKIRAAAASERISQETVPATARRLGCCFRSVE